MADDRWRRDSEGGDEEEEEVVDETVNPLTTCISFLN